jgi:hypothetical protein
VVGARPRCGHKLLASFLIKLIVMVDMPKFAGEKSVTVTTVTYHAKVPAVEW